MDQKEIQLRDKTIFLKGSELSEIDLQEILKVHYDNIEQEIADFPYILNQLNLLVIEAGDILRDEEFQLEVCKSNLEEYKGRISFEVIKELKEEGIKSPTVSDISNRIISLPDYIKISESIQIQRQKNIKLLRDKEMITSLYWSAKCKMDILINLSKNVILNK